MSTVIGKAATSSGTHVYPADLSAPCGAHLDVPSGSVRPEGSRIVGLFRLIKNWLIGALLCVPPIASVLVVGWTYRLMQRRVLRAWNRLSDLDPVDPGPSPGWLFQERGPRTIRSVLSPVWHNIRLGVQGVFNTYVLTFVPCLLWVFAWRFGWDNSFHKMYEQYIIGIGTWTLGNALFIAAMLYVPLAQARQAATGDWRAFYGFRVVWSLLRRRPITWAMLAAAYALLSIPTYAIMWAPRFVTQTSESVAAMSDAQLVWWLYRYYFWASVFLFPAFVLLRLMAARHYAKALPAAVRRGKVAIDDLHPFERQTLDRLGLLRVDPPADRHLILRAVGWTSTRFGRFMIGLAAVLLWLTVTLQISIAQFFDYHPRRYLIQPLIQLPWLTHIPAHLTRPEQSRDATDMGASMTGA